jgi:outer membrane protein assembly factor BamB
MDLQLTDAQGTALTDQIYAQPLYVHALAMPQGVRNVLFVATEGNWVYAFDADQGNQLWRLPLPGPVSPQSFPGFIWGYQVLWPWIGITSTPVIDRTRNRLYLVSASSSPTVPPTPIHTLYALDITTGNIVNSRIIQGSFSPAHGGGSTTGGALTFDPTLEKNRTGLLLQADTIYVAFGGAQEHPFYHGWVFGFNADTLNPVGTYATNPDGAAAGIWQSGNGLAGDGSAIYATTGNGAYIDDSDAGLQEFVAGDARGSSVVKLTSDLKEADWFKPFNYECLSSCDLDLSTGGAVLLPGLSPWRVVAGGKEGRVYVLNSNNLGHGPILHDTQILQSFKATEHQDDPSNALRRCEGFTCTTTNSPPHSLWTEVGLYSHIHGSPVVWTQNSGLQYRIYVQGERDRLKAFQYDNGSFQVGQQSSSCGSPGNAAPIDCSNEIAPDNTMPGGILSLSSNNQQVGSVILWVSIPQSTQGYDAENAIRSYDSNTGLTRGISGLLRAYDASNLKNKLWETVVDQNRYVKFVPPTIANGKVYMAEIGKVAVFGDMSCPVVTSMNPLIGRDIGGSVFYLYGGNLDTNARGNLGWTQSVHFGVALASNLFCDSFSCSAVTPPGTGLVPVTLTRTGTPHDCPGVPSPPFLFRYKPTPTVTSISPTHGPVRGATLVTVTGSNFDTTAGATQFNFGLTQQAGQGSNVRCQSTTQCTTSSPLYVGADQNYVNPVDVVATVDAVLSSLPTLADEFTYDGLIKPPPCKCITCCQ